MKYKTEHDPGCMGWEDCECFYASIRHEDLAALRARCARLEGALYECHLALTDIGSRLQNDRGEWIIRKPHSEMARVVQRINAAMIAYHDTVAEARARGAVGETENQGDTK